MAKKSVKNTKWTTSNTHLTQNQARKNEQRKTEENKETESILMNCKYQ